MDVMDAIRHRHSYRSFKSEPLSREVLATLSEAAAHAPSSMNSQPVQLFIATGQTRSALGKAMALSTVHLEEYVEIIEPELYEKAVEFYANLGGAPVVMAVTLPKATDDLQRINELLAAGAAVENLMLAATEFGVGTCNLTISFWVRDELAEVLELADDREVVSIIVAGYPAEEPAAPRHRLDLATYLE